MPRCGAAAAWAALPWKRMVTRVAASAPRTVMVRAPGWNIIAASIPSNTPARSIRILPPPPSSAGVPITSSSPLVASSSVRGRGPRRATRR
jgi:hypothetical protein